MTIYVIRHAHAGARGAWPGDDRDRPLSDKGKRQAAHLTRLLADAPITAVYSSPFRRCLETVTQLAECRGLTPQAVPELNEGGAGDRAVRFALDHAAEHPVLCSHGDLIPKMLRRLSAGGMRSPDGNVAAKGSLWVLDVDPTSGKVLTGTYHAPG